MHTYFEICILLHWHLNLPVFSLINVAGVNLMEHENQIIRSLFGPVSFKGMPKVTSLHGEVITSAQKKSRGLTSMASNLSEKSEGIIPRATFRRLIFDLLLM